MHPSEWNPKKKPFPWDTSKSFCGFSWPYILERKCFWLTSGLQCLVYVFQLVILCQVSIYCWLGGLGIGLGFSYCLMAQNPENLRDGHFTSSFVYTPSNPRFFLSDHSHVGKTGLFLVSTSNVRFNELWTHLISSSASNTSWSSEYVVHVSSALMKIAYCFLPFYIF